jgi:DNA-binding response OmpR family regulator/AraC-like DNA-binding protein
MLAPVDRPVVLAVDDDAGVREALTMLLEEAYDVVTADSGPGALAVLASRPVDVVLLDIRMPHVDGLETLARIRLAHPDVAVIMVSALSDVSAVVRSMKLGAFDYVTKPWETTEVLAVVERAVQRRRGGSPIALLVGADAAALSALEAVIQDGVRVVQAPVAGDALAAVDGGQVRLALVDVDDAGPDVVACVRTLAARLPERPIVLLAPAGARRSLVAEVPATPSIRFVGRPCRLDEVRRVVATIVGGEWPPLPPQVPVAIEHIASRYRESLSVAEIARAAGVSPDHLTRLFREALGIGIKDYLRRVRVAVAARLLAGSDRKLEDVAELAGFHDASHLSRVFIDEAGTRPGMYRRRCRPAPWSPSIIP